jgi:hypothetical protein
MQNDVFRKKILNYGIVICLLLSALFIALNVWGYGTLVYQPAANERVFINDIQVDNTELATDGLRVRPGSYTIRTQSARYETTETSVSVGLLRTTTYEPTLTERSLDSIISAAIGASGTYGLPVLVSPTWFEDDQWLTGIVGPGSAQPIALQYNDGVWSVAYSLDSGYNQDVKKLPPAVAKKIEALIVRSRSQ